MWSFLVWVVIFFIKWYYIKRIEGVSVDIVLSFFTDTLSGYVYVITTVISIILILGIIGFLSERKFNLENNHILTRNYNKENEN